MYSVFKNNKLVRTFNEKSKADWFAYSLQRLGHRVEVQPAPTGLLCDIVNDLENINYLDQPAFISHAGERVWY